MIILEMYVYTNVTVLCYVMLCYVMLCYVMLCYVMLCYVMLCYVMLCYVMLCYVTLCYVMCYVLCFIYFIYKMNKCPHVMSSLIARNKQYRWQQCAYMRARVCVCAR